LKWNAPGGNPNSAQGASITPTYAAEGAKVVTAICGSKSATKNVTVAISCANVNPPNLNAEQVNQAPDANPVGAVIFGQVHFDQSHSAKYKGCAENFKWCFRLEEFKEKHGVGIRSNGRIDITGANDPNVDPAHCIAILADLNPPPPGTPSGPPRTTYYSSAITQGHENFHVDDFRAKVMVPTMNQLAQFVSNGNNCTECKSDPPAAFNNKMETLWNNNQPTYYDGFHEVRAHNFSNPMYSALRQAIKTRAQNAPAAENWPQQCK